MTRSYNEESNLFVKTNIQVTNQGSDIKQIQQLNGEEWVAQIKEADYIKQNNLISQLLESSNLSEVFLSHISYIYHAFSDDNKPLFLYYLKMNKDFINKDNIMPLLNLSSTDPELYNALIITATENEVPLPSELINKIDFEKLGYDYKNIMNLLPSMLQSLTTEQQKDLEIWVSKLLSRIRSSNEDKEFITNFLQALNEVTSSNDMLKALLQKTLDFNGTIYIKDSKFSVKGSLVPGVANSKHISVSTLNSSIDDIIKVFFHECTHFLLYNIFNNHSLPFTKDSSEDEILQKLILKELEEDKILHSQLYIKNLYTPNELISGFLLKENWVLRMANEYPQGEHTSEVVSWFIEQIVQKTQNQTLSREIHKELAEKLWDYIHKGILSNNTPPVLPQVYYLDESIMNSIEMTDTALTLEAKKIVVAEGPSIEWVSKEAGRLAFLSLPKIIRSSFIANIFKNEVKKLNLNNIISLIQSADDLKTMIIDKLFELKGEDLYRIVNQDNIVSLMQSADYFKTMIIDKLFELKGEDLYRIVNQDNIVSLIRSADYFKTMFIDKLFALEGENLHHIVNQNNIASLIQSADDLKTMIIDKLFELKGEDLYRIVNQDNIVSLMQSADDLKTMVINKLFELKGEDLYRIVNQDNIVSLMQSADYLKTMVINKLFELKGEDLYRIVNQDNIVSLMQSADYFKTMFIDKLFALEGENLHHIVNQNNIASLIQSADVISKKAILNKVFELEGENLYRIVNQDNIVSLMRDVDDLQSMFIDKLFALEGENLHHIVNQNNIASLIQSVDIVGKNTMLNKVFELEGENLYRMVNQDNIVSLMRDVDILRSMFIDKLFALEGENLYRIVNQDNIVSLVQAAENIKPMIVKKLHDLGKEHLDSIITPENIDSLVHVVGGEKNHLLWSLNLPMTEYNFNHNDHHTEEENNVLVGENSCCCTIL